jgi:LPXTG-motif cell wall-anchored protein
MAYPGSCPAPSGGGNEDTGSNTLLIAAGAVGFGALLLFVLRRQRQAR